MKSGKQVAREIFAGTLAALDTPRVMERKLALEGDSLVFDGGAVRLSKDMPLFVVAIGKASHAMAKGLRLLLPETYEFTGVVAAPTNPTAPIPGLEYFVGGHPNPNEGSWRAAEAILALLRQTSDKSVVFFLLSGGGSALA